MNPLGAVRPSPPNVTVSPDAEAAEWADAGRERTPPAVPAPHRETLGDWLGARSYELIGTPDDATQILPDDPHRRSAVVRNVGALAFWITANDSPIGGASGAFMVAAGAELTLRTTRAVYARPLIVASLSVVIERNI